MKTRIALAVIIAVSSMPCVSEITRSVDSEGNVTFSDQAVPGSVEATPVVIDTPSPSRQEVSESEQQAQDMINRANLNQQPSDSSTAGKKERIQAAQRNLDAANAHLKEVEVVREGDRQALAGGGTKLRPEYLLRVQEAEQQVSGAQKRLDAAKMAR